MGYTAFKAMRARNKKLLGKDLGPKQPRPAKGARNGTDLKSAALRFLHDRCEGLRFDPEIAQKEAETGVYLGTGIRPGQVPFNMQKDTDRLCLERELEKFIDTYNDMLPEIERFGQMSWKEVFGIVSMPAVKKLRTSNNRQYAGMNMYNNAFRFDNREGMDSSKMTADERKFREKAYRRMMSSKYIPLAMNGLDGLMTLKYGMVDIMIKNANDENQTALAFYYDELKRIMNNVSTMSSKNGSCTFKIATEGFVKERMEIEDIAVRRMNWSEPFGDMLLTGYEKWPVKTAKEVYDKLLE